MKKVFGIIILLLAITVFLAVFRLIKKRGTYKGDFGGLILDSIEFIVLIAALALVGIILITEK